VTSAALILFKAWAVIDPPIYPPPVIGLNEMEKKSLIALEAMKLAFFVLGAAGRLCLIGCEGDKYGASLPSWSTQLQTLDLVCPCKRHARSKKIQRFHKACRSFALTTNDVPRPLAVARRTRTAGALMGNSVNRRQTMARHREPHRAALDGVLRVRSLCRGISWPLSHRLGRAAPQRQE